MLLEAGAAAKKGGRLRKAQLWETMSHTWSRSNGDYTIYTPWFLE